MQKSKIPIEQSHYEEKVGLNKIFVEKADAKLQLKKNFLDNIELGKEQANQRRSQEELERSASLECCAN